jgi:acyl dehydratase
MADSVITDEMRAVVGVDGPASVAEVTSTGVRMFARAVGYTDSIHYDEEAAKARGYHGLVAPLGYLGTPIFTPGGGRTQGAPGSDIKVPYKRVLNGGTTYQYFAPVIAGDVITSRSRISEFREREGSMGAMLITYRETSFTNQDGQVVAKMLGNLIQY